MNTLAHNRDAGVGHREAAEPVGFTVDPDGRAVRDHYFLVQNSPADGGVRADAHYTLVHDGIGVWLAARRLNQGRFTWPAEGAGTLTLSRAQFDALVLGLPWQRVGDGGIITLL